MVACGACGTGAPPDSRFCGQCGARLDDAAPTISPELRSTVLTSIRAEHRLVTVVFADMAGSVRRTRELDAEGATALVSPLLETMVEVMVRYGGRIDRFLGDGVLAVFGVPIAHEDDPIRAVRAALALRDRAAEIGFDVTAGVNTGRVYFGPVGSSIHEELTVMGPVVNLAARLQGAAATGEVLAGSDTEAHIRAAFDLRRRSVPIKGMEDPVEVYAVERLLDHPGKVRGIEGLRSELVGRADELEVAVAEIESGSGAVALTGDAGLGKTRLATEVERRVGGTWLEGHCLELTRDVPYAAIADLIRRHLGAERCTATGLRAWLESLAGAGGLEPSRVDELVPYLAEVADISLGDPRDDALAGADPAQRRRLTIAAVVEVLSAIAPDDHPVVFVDDVQWADDLSVDVLAHLLSRRPGDRPALLVTARPDDDGVVARLADADPGLLDLTLRPLGDDDSTHLLRGLLSISGLPRHVERDVIAWAAGNPFYVEELIRSLIQRGMVERRHDRWVEGDTPARLEIPDSVDGLVMSRYDRLPEGARRAGQVAAVLDRTFTDDRFRRIVGSDPADALGMLVSADFLHRSDDGYRFVHALTREAVYASLLPSQKQELHHRVAEAIRELEPDDHESLAHHYERTSDHEAAVTHLLAAGHRAMDRYLNDAAAGHIERGLQRIDSLPSPEQDGWRGRYLLLRGRLRERSGDFDDALADLERAERLVDDPGTLGTVRCLIGRIHRLSGRFDLAHEWLDRAETAVEDRDHVVSVWIDVQVERAHALYFGGRGRELPAFIDRVGPRIRRHGTAAQRADALGFQALYGFVADRFRMSEPTVDTCASGLEIALGGADPGRIADARFRLGFCLLWADEVDDAIPALQQSLAEARRVGDVMLETRAASYLAIALRRAGDVDGTNEAVSDALETATRIGDDYYRGHALATRAWTRWRSGDLEGARRDGLGAVDSWGRFEREGASGLDVEFAWMAAWPLAAVEHRLGDDRAAASYLEWVATPWERPVADALMEAVTAAVDSPGPDTVGRALELAGSERLL